jgi:NAD(P)H-dependent FMN reductase
MTTRGIEMAKNIVILSGSPRKGGNTDTLVQAFINGAEAAGKTVKNIRVADMDIHHCRGCGGCQDHRAACGHRDDFYQIMHEIRFADALVLASPVYFFNITGALKTAIDRLYAFQKIGTPVKQCALLLTCADKDPDTAAGAVAMYERMAAYLKWAQAGEIIAAGLEEKDDIHTHAALAQARALGGVI